MESKLTVNEVKWNSNQIITFFEMYHKHDCLWDASSPCYLKRDIKNSALESLVNELIAEGFKITLTQLKSKIKSLRDTYRNEVNKIKKSKKSGAAAEDVYKPKLAWFPTADAFLRNIFIGRNSSSNLVVSFFLIKGETNSRSSSNFGTDILNILKKEEGSSTPNSFNSLDEAPSWFLRSIQLRTHLRFFLVFKFNNRRSVTSATCVLNNFLNIFLLCKGIL